MCVCVCVCVCVKVYYWYCLQPFMHCALEHSIGCMHGSSKGGVYNLYSKKICSALNVLVSVSGIYNVAGLYHHVQ